MLADQNAQHHADAWLVNTGWSGGPYGIGSRIPLPYTRAILDAVHRGTLAAGPTQEEPVFGLTVPADVPGVPRRMLLPRDTWSDPAAYDRMAERLAGLFDEHFRRFAADASDETRAAGPRLAFAGKA